MIESELNYFFSENGFVVIDNFFSEAESELINNFSEEWINGNISNAGEVVTFMAVPVKSRLGQYLVSSAQDNWYLE